MWTVCKFKHYFLCINSFCFDNVPFHLEMFRIERPYINTKKSYINHTDTRERRERMVIEDRIGFPDITIVQIIIDRLQFSSNLKKKFQCIIHWYKSCRQAYFYNEHGNQKNNFFLPSFKNQSTDKLESMWIFLLELHFTNRTHGA